jgi:uncharacterized Zn finger protein
MDKDTADVLEALDFIKERMATRDDVNAIKRDIATKDDVREIIREDVPLIVREETNDIRAELASIRRDLEELTDKVDNIIGLPKEIDHALERIAAIEEHLGISKKVVA